MTVQEFSVEFDILYNNITSGMAPGLTEYEKSVFLTQAQETTVTELYSGRQLGPFEGDEEARAYLHTLIKEASLKKADFSQKDGMLAKSFVTELPNDVLYIISENVVLSDDELSCKDSNERLADVYPVTHDTLYRTFKSPFRGANERRVLRLDTGTAGYIREVQLITKYDFAEYIVRYLRKPLPIILVELENKLTINGEYQPMTSELPEIIHRTILLKAVELAKAVWKA